MMRSDTRNYKASTLLATAALLATTTTATATSLSSTEKKITAAGPLHFILSADDGSYSGTHEQKYILEKTKITYNLTEYVPFCQSAYLGTIDTGKVVVGGDDDKKVKKNSLIQAILVTSGIGAVTAALCTQQATEWVLKNMAVSQPSSSSSTPAVGTFPFAGAYFMGTSGWSPYVGGLNPKSKDGTCGVNRTNSPTAQRVSIGSVCVSPISYDVDCGFHVENPKAQGQDGECHDLGYSDTWARSDLFGKCSYSSAGPKQGNGEVLADTILKSTSVLNPSSIPKMDDDLKSRVNTFWKANELGKEAPNFSVPTVPFVTTRCAEAVSHAIWVGAQMDYQCRVLTGKLLAQKGLLGAAQTWIPTTDDASLSSSSTAGDDEDSFVCSSAMEGYGFLSAITRFMPDVPAVIIRGASNYVMYPLFKSKGANGGADYWQQNPEYVSRDDELKFSSAGYHYAIQTTNQVLLNYLATL